MNAQFYPPPAGSRFFWDAGNPLGFLLFTRSKTSLEKTTSPAGFRRKPEAGADQQADERSILPPARQLAFFLGRGQSSRIASHLHVLKRCTGSRFFLGRRQSSRIASYSHVLKRCAGSRFRTLVLSCRRLCRCLFLLFLPGGFFRLLFLAIL